MARPDPTQFRTKTRLVATAVAVARGRDRRNYDFSAEVAPGVRLVLAESSGCPLAFSLWTRQEDIAEICADGAVPVASALLAVDGAQARAAADAGCTIALDEFTRSQALPGLYYVLLDQTGVRRLQTVLRRLVPGSSAPALAA
jgi:hypothetical protein